VQKFLLNFLIVSPLVSSFSQAAVFGVDDRQPVYSFSQKANLGRATAIALLTGNSTFTADKKSVDIDVSPLSGTLCSDQKFVSDVSLSYSCTGFLVAPDLLVTAGHCVSNHSEVKNETGGYCEVFDWLFDYQATPTSAPRTSGISTEKVYHCKQIIYAVQDEVAPFRDYALIQLDRPVLDRQPLTISTAPVQMNDAVTMLGYPLGSPLKLSQNAKIILTNPLAHSFVTNLDAFDGNSGSPVFNAKNEVIGILVAGTPEVSLIHDDAHACYRYNHCDEDGKNCLVPDKDPAHISGFQTTGSDVARIAPVLELVRQQQNH
jgi:V8-like Glu-specific endopeptidase